jgi:hypothetical protein
MSAQKNCRVTTAALFREKNKQILGYNKCVSKDLSSPWCKSKSIYISKFQDSKKLCRGAELSYTYDIHVGYNKTRVMYTIEGASLRSDSREGFPSTIYMHTGSR